MKIDFALVVEFVHLLIYFLILFYDALIKFPFQW